MTLIAGIKFKKAGRLYHFDANELNIKQGDNCIVETARGLEFGTCAAAPKEAPDSAQYKKIIRIATPEDEKTNCDNKKKQEDAAVIFNERVLARELEMKLTDIEMTFDSTKIIFYFTADGRVDFRELVKDLASMFKMRIELRQIGVRDEARILNGVGFCGKSLCCATFLCDFAPVSIKMAKEQNLSLNPTKISGCCGRLMCCLKYEEETYEFLNRGLPELGDIVKTPDGTGEALYVGVLRQQVKVAVRAPDSDAVTVNMYPVADVTIIEKKPKDDSAYTVY